jgi:hypothetical protein
MNLSINGQQIDTGDKNINDLLMEWWESGQCNYESFSIWLLEKYKQSI